MFLKFVLLIIALIVILVGYLLYAEYSDDLRFRGETFRESRGVDAILNLIIPKDTRILDNRLFRLFGSEETLMDSNGNFTKKGSSIKSFYVAKLLCLVCSFVLAFAVMYTNFFNNRIKVFEQRRDIPFLITESDYKILTNDLSFQKLDYVDDLKKLSEAKKYVKDPVEYLPVDLELLYNVLSSMNKDYNSAFGLGVISSGLLIVLMGWFLPNMFVSFTHNLMIKNSDLEFSKLEGYIYINCHKRVSEIIRGLCQESIFYKTQMEAFRLRYQEDRILSYDLILQEKQLSENFRTLINYLKLLEDSDVEFIRESIRVNQENFRANLRRSILNDISSKTAVISTLLFGTIVVSGLVLVFNLFKNVSF